MKLDTGTASRLRTRHKEAKIAYIKLNRQTPCPPRGAVPVNPWVLSEILSTLNTRFAFGHGGDHPGYVNVKFNPIPGVSNVELKPFILDCPGQSREIFRWRFHPKISRPTVSVTPSTT